jgi:hypothetical protein
MYSKFLAENFKLSHGIDLIRTFKKNNKTCADDFDPFNHTKWLKKIESSYKHSHHQFRTMVESCFHDRIAWKFANQKPRKTKPGLIIPGCNHLNRSTFETITDTSLDDWKMKPEPEPEPEVPRTASTTFVSVKMEPEVPRIAPKTSESVKMEPEVLSVVEHCPTTLKLVSPRLKMEQTDEPVSSQLTEPESIKSSPRKRLAGFGTFASRKKRKSTQTS